MSKDKLVLVTGACGFIGSHLMDKFRPDAIGTTLTPTVVDLNMDGCTRCDVTNYYDLLAIVKKHRPKYIYHMAAQSYPVLGQVLQKETLEVNIGGTMNLFKAIMEVRGTREDYDPVVVVACSSAEYGNGINTIPIPEDTQLLPVHVYGVSKVAQDLLAYQYHLNFGIKVIRARIFNTTGPRKQGDLISDLVSRFNLAKIKKEKSIPVGNIHTVRAFLDVRDLISAFEILVSKGRYGQAYNISSEDRLSVLDIAEKVKFYTGHTAALEVATSLIRPKDELVIAGDTTELKKLGWKQEYNIDSTIKSMVEYDLRR